jgi:hypothetical protein
MHELQKSNLREGLAPELEKPPISYKMNGAMMGRGGTPPKSMAFISSGEVAN